MEQNQIPQRRVRFSQVLQLQDKEGELEESKERPFPPLIQPESFKGTEKLGFLWNMPRMERESEPIDSEFAATIAAAAFAVHSLDETRIEYQKKMMASFKEKEQSKSSRSVSRRGSFDMADNSVRRRRSSESEARELGREIMVRTNSTRSIGTDQRRVLTKAEAWEKDELKKIDKRYRKMISKITEWENERKIKAKLVMEKRMAELERMRKLTSLHQQRKTEWIDSVARGARTQLEEKKRSEESNVKVKARKIRSNGKVPVKCLCFEFYR